MLSSVYIQQIICTLLYGFKYSYLIQVICKQGNPRGTLDNVLDFDTVESEFELQSRYCVHFWINTPRKGMDTYTSPQQWFNTTTKERKKEKQIGKQLYGFKYSYLIQIMLWF